MQRYRAVYFAAVILGGIVSVTAVIVYPVHDLLFLAVGDAVLAVLTFPLGAAASATGAALIFLGFATPAEAAFLMTPAFAALGYIQWFRLLPACYGKSR